MRSTCEHQTGGVQSVFDCRPICVRNVSAFDTCDTSLAAMLGYDGVISCFLYIYFRKMTVDMTEVQPDLQHNSTGPHVAGISHVHPTTAGTRDECVSNTFCLRWHKHVWNMYLYFWAVLIIIIIIIIIIITGIIITQPFEKQYFKLKCHCVPV